MRNASFYFLGTFRFADYIYTPTLSYGFSAFLRLLVIVVGVHKYCNPNFSDLD